MGAKAIYSAKKYTLYKQRLRYNSGLVQKLHILQTFVYTCVTTLRCVLCKVTHVTQIIHLVQEYTLCCIVYTVWYYTEAVKLLQRKVLIFCVHSGKIYTGQKKFTRAPPVVPVTNMRYELRTLYAHLPTFKD